MNLKCLFLIFALVVQVSEVKSDCDHFLGCISEVFRDFFGVDKNSTEIVLYDNKDHSEINGTDVDIDRKGNTSINVFDLTGLQRGLNKVLTDLTSFFTTNSDIIETINNDTEIFVKTIDLDKITGDLLMNKDARNNISIDNSSQTFEQLFNVRDAKEHEKDDFTSYVNKSEILTSNVTFVKELPILIDEDTKIESEQANVKTSETIHTQPFYLEIIPDKLLESHRNFENFAKTVNTGNNKEEIYIQPLHIDLTPDIVLHNDEEINNIVKNATDILINNLSISQIPDIIKHSIDDTHTKSDKTQTQKDLEIVITNNPGSIQYITKNLTSDLNLTTTVPFNVTKTFDIQIPNVTKLHTNKFENVLENEISTSDQDFELYYDIGDDNSTDYPIIDYLELYKDTTNEYIEYKPTETPTSNIRKNEEGKTDLDNVIDNSAAKEGVLRNSGDNANYSNPNDTSIAETFPWVATIFIKNGSNDQFDYFCDGAILSQNVILTAARCVNPSNTKVEVENVIIILGKTSLQTSGDGERVHRVKQIKTHDNFTISGSEAANDLAVLELEEPITFSSTILPARIEGDVLGEVGEAFTTGWAISGNLTAIHFDKEKTQSCVKNTVSENVFCATYDYDVATCPNHGGLYILRLGDQWSLQGIRTGDTTDRSFCIDKTVLYTALSGYTRWVTDKINENKAV